MVFWKNDDILLQISRADQSFGIASSKKIIGITFYDFEVSIYDSFKTIHSAIQDTRACQAGPCVGFHNSESFEKKNV